MKITIYELLGMIKDEPDRSIYVKYFDRVNEKDDVMLACAENIIYKLDHSNIELNDEVEILEEEKKIPEKLDDRILLYRRIEDLGIPLKDMLDKINEIINYLDYLESKGE